MTSSRQCPTTSRSTASCWSIRDGEVAPFNDLQQRLNRKTPTPKMLDDFPASVRLYDILRLGDEDLRDAAAERAALSLDSLVRQRAARSARSVAAGAVRHLGRLIKELRDNARANGIEGLMLKRATRPICRAGRKARGSNGSAAR
jgi:DNA ligase-1